MRSLALCAALAVLLTLTLAGCSSKPQGPGGATATTTVTATVAPTTVNHATTSTTSKAPNYNVDLTEYAFDPTTLTVPNYQKVIFTNKGQLTHTVTIVRKGDPPGTTYLDQPLQPGSTTSFNFPNDGTYTVYCRYHGTEQGTGMAMTISV